MRNRLPTIQRSTLLIPKQVCGWVTENRFHNPFRLYLFLNISCSGKRKINNRDIEDIASVLQVSTRTVRNNLKKLLDYNWIGYNFKSKYYHIRGIHKIRQMYGFTGLLCADFDIQWILQSKAFTESVLIAYLINYQRKKKRIGFNSAEHNQRVHAYRSNQAEPKRITAYPIACRGISKCLKLSRSKAHNMKQAGKKHFFLDVNKSYTKTDIELSALPFFRELNPKIANRISVIDENVVIINPDLISHCIRFKNKPKPLQKPLVKK